MSGPLEGIRVLDLSRVLAGPWAAQLLADYGADVIKVERPDGGDETRRWGPPWLRSPEGKLPDAAYFLAANRNKWSITCNFAHPDGAAVVRDLAAGSDVVIENFRSGALKRYGLDADALQAGNPRLVFCSITAFGGDGPRAEEPGYDAVVQASAGLMSITGEPAAQGGRPQKVGVAIADIMAGMYAASAILASLRARERTGRGERIDVPLFDTQVAWLANQAMNFLVGGSVPQRQGTAHPNIVPYQTFSTGDGELMLAVGSDRQFRALTEALGRTDLGDDPRYADNPGRVSHREELVPELARSFSERSTAHWLRVLKSKGVPAGPVNDLAQVFADEHVVSQRLVQELPHTGAGKVPTVVNPVRFASSGKRLDLAPPVLGEHTDQVLHDVLGYTRGKIAALRADGAI